MSFCQNCGNKLDPKAKFCPECGTKVKDVKDERKSSWEGEVHKCPQCGEIVGAFQYKCISCGHEFRNTRGSEAVKQFEAELQEIHQFQKPKENFVKGFLNDVLGKEDDIEKIRHEKIVTHIRNFAIPNSKEDIIEFLILASSNIDPQISIAKKPTEIGMKTQEEFEKAKELNDAWQSKADQSYQKALVSFQNDPDFKKIYDLYERTIDKVFDAEERRSAKRIRTWLIVGAVIAGFYFLSFLMQAFRF